MNFTVFSTVPVWVLHQLSPRGKNKHNVEGKQALRDHPQPTNTPPPLWRPFFG